jgi:NAD+ kinase
MTVIKKYTDIGIIIKPAYVEDLNNILSNLVRWLILKKKKILFLEKEQKRIMSLLNVKYHKIIHFADEKNLFSKTHLIISLGGDGTLIGLSRLISPNIPVFGINLGHLGFTTEFSKSNYYDELNNASKRKI